ncbi:MAG: hypothetical protein PHE15_06675, partial [Dehalococcoidales bacterium]|nr:hypothetical protein [Dehalococcoidales bacterium]
FSISTEVLPPWMLPVIIIIGLLILIALIIFLIKSIRKNGSESNLSYYSEVKTGIYEKRQQPVTPVPSIGEEFDKPVIEEVPRVNEVVEIAKPVQVTVFALKKLQEMLRAKTSDPELFFRLSVSPLDATQLNMKIDKIKAGDTVIESDGIKVLAIVPEASKALEGRTIDYQETEQGGEFSVVQ